MINPITKKNISNTVSLFDFIVRYKKFYDFSFKTINEIAIQFLQFYHEWSLNIKHLHSIILLSTFKYIFNDNDSLDLSNIIRSPFLCELINNSTNITAESQYIYDYFYLVDILSSISFE